MKVVLHICNGIDSNRGGGIKSFLKDLINRNCIGYRNIVVILSCYETDFSFLCSNENVSIYSLNYSLIKQKGTISVNKFLKLLKTVDVIHQHSMWRLPSVISIFSSIILKKKVIFQPHGALITNAIRKNIFFKSLFFYFVERLNLKTCSVIIINSRLEKHELIERIKNKRELVDKIVYVPLGVKSDFILEPNLEFREKIKRKYKKRKVIAFISRLHEGKGVELLIRSFANIVSKNDGLVLKIGGIGSQDYEHRIRKIVAEYDGLDKRVFFLNYLDEEGKKQLLDDAYLFVLPSSNESFSLSIAEALSRGVPVITSKFTPWGEINQKSGLITELTEQSLEQCIEFFSFQINDENYLEYCVNANKLIVERFIFEDNVKILENEYL